VPFQQETKQEHEFGEETQPRHMLKTTPSPR